MSAPRARRRASLRIKHPFQGWLLVIVSLAIVVLDAFGFASGSTNWTTLVAGLILALFAVAVSLLADAQLGLLMSQKAALRASLAASEYTRRVYESGFHDAISHLQEAWPDAARDVRTNLMSQLVEDAPLPSEEEADPAD